MKNLTFGKLSASHYRHLAFLALVTVIIIVGVQGIEHGNVNNFRDQSIQLPVIYSYADPDLYAGDFFLDARDSYITLFYPTLGILSRYVDLSLLMQGLYILATLATIGAIYTLANLLFPYRRVGLVAVFLWMGYLPNPGGDFTHSPFVTHTTFAIAIELWALVFIFRRKYGVAAALLGIAANVNAMTAFFVGFMWVFALLVERKVWSWRLISLPFIMGFSALPILIWRFSMPLTEASLDEFVHIIRTRLWYAVFPFSIEPILWLGFFALMALWVYSFRFGKPTEHKQVLAMVNAISILALIGFVFSEIIPVEFVIELQLIRSTWLINLLMIFYLANLLMHWLTGDNRQQQWLAFGLMAAFTIPRWVIDLNPPSQPTPYKMAVDLDTTPMVGHPMLVALTLCITIAVLVAIVYRMVQKESDAPFAQKPGLLMGWMVFGTLLLVGPAFIDSNVPTEQDITTHDWEDALVWVHDNTPEDAVFVTPPNLDGFRVIAQRPYIGDWKDGTVGIFHNGWAIEWYERMEALGFDDASFSFLPMTQERLCNVQGRYAPDYVMVFKAWEIRGTPEYENGTFAIIPSYDLDCTVEVKAGP